MNTILKRTLITTAALATAGVIGWQCADRWPVKRKAYELPKLDGCPQPSAELAFYLTGRIHGEAFLTSEDRKARQPFFAWDDGIFQDTSMRLWDPNTKAYRTDVSDLSAELNEIAKVAVQEKIDAFKRGTSEAVKGGVDAVKKEYQEKGITGIWRSRGEYREQASDMKERIILDGASLLDSDGFRCGQSLVSFGYGISAR